MLAINDDEKNIILEILSKNLPDANFWAFGSRINDTAKKYSDLDIAIIDHDKIPLNKITVLKDDLSQTDIPYIIDIVDYNRISDEFKNHITNSHIKLN